MTPEKKNRIKTIINILIIIVCLGVTVFLLVRYLKVRSQINNSSSDTQTTSQTAEIQNPLPAVLTLLYA